MARWRWNTSRTSLSSLYERTPRIDEIVAAGQLHPDFHGLPPTTSLVEVFNELRLNQPSELEERRLRFALGLVIAVGMKTFELSAAYGGLQISDVQVILRRIAKDVRALSGSANAGEMQKIERWLHGAETGFHHAHETAIALLIINTLAQEIGRDKARDRVHRAETGPEDAREIAIALLAQEIGRDRARDRILNFRKWPRTVAATCLRAVKDLDKIKDKGGRPSLDWYHDFKRILTCIAEKNSISPTVEINRETGKAQGRFVELVEQFEQLLPPMLRSPSPEAMAKRLQRKTGQRQIERGRINDRKWEEIERKVAELGSLPPFPLSAFARGGIDD